MNLSKYTIIFLALGFSVPGLAANPRPAAAQACTSCHGAEGRSNNPLWPNLAGQKADYLLKQLHDFRAGRRKDPVMGPMSQTIDEKDLAALVEYFSKL